MLDSAGQRAVYFGTLAIYVYDIGDDAAEAACIAMLSRAGLATDIDIAQAFGCHRNTVARKAERLTNEGMAAVIPARRGPKGPSKATDEVLAVVKEHAASLSSPALRLLIIEETGVTLSEAYVRVLAATQRATFQQQTLGDGAPGEGAGGTDDVAGSGRGDAADDPRAVTDSAAAHPEVDEPQADSPRATLGERTDPRRGAEVSWDPPAVLPKRTSGRYVGLALYYPALAAVGLLEAAASTFALPRSERFGVRATTLSMFFMTLLSKTTLEAAKHLRRAEFGAMVGSGRAPCVKTLRRKLAELADQAKASDFGVTLARRWVDAGIIATAYLYVDGHMKLYTGKRRLQEVWNSQRRMPLPGVHTYFVGDSAGRPLLFLTEDLSANLGKAMPRVIEAIEEVLGDRHFTVVFDRGGFDGELFTWLAERKVDFITYQRGTPKLDDGLFARRECRFEGRRVRFWLAEDTVMIAKSGPWRRIVVRTKDGHQTPIITNLGHSVPAARVACLMFARWRQENLFKYMGEHHGLDELVSYGVDLTDPDTLIPNPDRKRLDRQIAERRKELTASKARLGDAVLSEPKDRSRSAHGLKVAQRGAVKTLRGLEGDIEALVEQRRQTPPRVTVSDLGRPRHVMRLERKAIVDRIKISAYNAEEWLLDRLVIHYPHPNDVRDLLRSFAELSGEIRTSAGGVVVALDPPDTPIHRRALRGLVEDLNAIGTRFPGTEVPVTYEVRMHHSEVAA
jgi:transposase